MKIKRFNAATIAQIQPGTPTINIYHSGCFSLNRAAIIKMGFVESAAEHWVEIIQDEDRPKDWYVTMSTKGTGFSVKKDSGKKHHRFNSRSLSVIFLKFLESMTPNTSNIPQPLPSSALLLLGTEPVEHEGMQLWPIITSSYRPKNSR